MGRAFARPLILPWTWILSNLSSNIYASLLSQQHDYFHVVHIASNPLLLCDACLVQRLSQIATKHAWKYSR